MMPLPASTTDLEMYLHGLGEAMALLRQILREAEAQLAAATARDADGLTAATHRRETLFQRLAACNQRLGPMRLVVAALIAQRDRQGDAGRVRERHQEVRDLITAILTVDERTRGLLEARDRELRTSAQTLEAMAATLAAYRKVVAPPPAPAALVDRLG